MVAVTERQEKGRALKSVKKSLVEHQLLKHADSRETMQITWPGLHLVSFLPPVPHTLNPPLSPARQAKLPLWPSTITHAMPVQGHYPDLGLPWGSQGVC